MKMIQYTLVIALNTTLVYAMDEKPTQQPASAPIAIQPSQKKRTLATKVASIGSSSNATPAPVMHSSSAPNLAAAVAKKTHETYDAYGDTQSSSSDDESTNDLKTTKIGSPRMSPIDYDDGKSANLCEEYGELAKSSDDSFAREFYSSKERGAVKHSTHQLYKNNQK